MDRESERSKRSKEIFGDPDDYIEPNSSNINISGHPDDYIVTTTQVLSRQEWNLLLVIFGDREVNIELDINIRCISGHPELYLDHWQPRALI